MTDRTIHLHPDAPSKPAPGEPCNRCGVCCAAETYPAGRLVFRRKNGPCPALVRYDNRYTCDLAVMPDRYIVFLPLALRPLVARLFRRWISAGTGCDSLVSIVNRQ